MKKVIALMVGLVAGTASFAQTSVNADAPQPAAQPIQSRVMVTPDQKLKLFVAATPTTARIELLDEAGRQLFSRNTGLKSGLNQQFDISALTEGTYRLTIKVDGQLITKTFVVEQVPSHQMVTLGA